MSTIGEFDHIEAYFILWKRLCEKVLWFVKRTCKKYNWFWKKTNAIINKRRINITSTCRSMLYLRKQNSKKVLWRYKLSTGQTHCGYICKYRGAAHIICNLKFNVPNEIPAVFHNGLNNYYHFIIKELAQQMSLRENLNVLGKAKNSAKLFLFQKYVNYKNW